MLYCGVHTNRIVFPRDNQSQVHQALYPGEAFDPAYAPQKRTSSFLFAKPAGRWKHRYGLDETGDEWQKYHVSGHPGRVPPIDGFDLLDADGRSSRGVRTPRLKSTSGELKTSPPLDWCELFSYQQFFVGVGNET